MSEAPGAALGPETTLETGTAPADTPDRREQLGAALDALGDTPPDDNAPNDPITGEKPAETAPLEPVEAAPPEPWAEPPASWKKNADLYKTLPPEAQQYVSQREEEMRRGVEPLIPKAKFADEVNGVIQQYQANIQAAGVPPVAAIQTLMQADHILRNAPMADKIAYAQQLLQQYGVDLSGTDWANAPVDPRMAALQNELHNLRNTVTPIVQQQADSQNQALLSDIEAFSKDKPHFEAVRPAMAQLLQSGGAADLQDAYDKAMEPWGAILKDAEAGKQAAEAAQRKAAADQAAKAARAAAVQVRTTSPGRAATPPNAPDRRAMLAEQLDGVDGRV